MARSSRCALLGIVVLLFQAAPAIAAENRSDPWTASEVRRELAIAQGHIDNGQYQRAIRVLDDIVRNEPNNADAHNLLGFSYRKMENFTRAETHYDRALRVEPAHRGALEYAGELYLQTGRRAQAEATSRRLEQACPAGCEELDALRAALSGGSARRW